VPPSLSAHENLLTDILYYAVFRITATKMNKSGAALGFD